MSVALPTESLYINYSICICIASTLQGTEANLSALRAKNIELPFCVKTAAYLNCFTSFLSTQQLMLCVTTLNMVKTLLEIRHGDGTGTVE
jgi:hypothetical protein